MNLLTCVYFLSLSVGLSIQAVDWCAIPKCPPKKHIACNNKGAFYSSCINPKEIVLSASQKKLVIDQHNKFRNQVASGNLTRYKPSTRMAKAKWNDQMAWLASLNTKQCKMEHDVCRNTPSYNYSGQNLAMLMAITSYTTEHVIERGIEKWYLEYPLGNMLDISKFQKGALEKGCAHFTTLVVDRQVEIGCAISSFRATFAGIWYNHYLLACNYASASIQGCSIYKAGPPASECKSGVDPVHKALCKTTETFDTNSCT